MSMLTEVIQPEELSEFKGMGPHMPTTEIDIPEKEENRFPTDRNFLIAFGVYSALLMPFLIYMLCYSDIRRIYLQDDCGNICGEKNPEFHDGTCHGEDYTDKKYLKRTDFVNMKCVEDCGKGYEDQYGLCVAVRENATDYIDLYEKNTYMYLSSWAVVFKLILSFLVTVGVSVGVLFLFRYAIGCVVWTIIGGVVILGTVMVGLLWSEYADNSMPLLGCLLGTAFLVVFVIMVYCFRHRIRLVVLLLTEATSAVFAIPSLFVIPICTFFAQIVILTLFLITTVYMISTGQAVRDSSRETTLKVSDGTAVTMFYNLVVTLWTLYFAGGLQYMVIGGAVSDWYFSYDKTSLYKPVKRSFARAYKFHMGTVAFGSLILTLAAIVRAIINSLTKSRFTKKLVDCCLRNIQGLLEVITKGGYTVTAMHGQPFLKSSKRAARLLVTNLKDVVAINIFVDMTLIAVAILIALVSLLLSAILFLGDPYDVRNTAEIIVFIMALFAGVTFVFVFQTTIDTIFLCFCEDKLLNDGMARPYAMSRELMDFVENAKKAVGGKQSYAQVDEQIPSVV